MAQTSQGLSLVTPRAFASTHVGRRANNEDAYRADHRLGLFLVADGMGGYEGGEVASQLVVDVVHRFFHRLEGQTDVGITRTTGRRRSVAESLMEMAIRQASGEVSMKRVGVLAKMGTTLAALLVRDGSALITHVGDSRVYRLRGGVLEQLTCDHTAMVDEGIAAVSGARYRAPRATHVITRAVGVEGRCAADHRIETAVQGDRFLLCTDGLTDVLPDAEIADILRSMEPDRAVDALICDAYGAGGRDNITAMVIAIE